MNIRARQTIHEAAKDALVRAREPQKIVLVYSAVCCGLSLLATVLSLLLSDRISGTGGLGNIGLRSVLSTGQSILPMINLIVTACMSLGYHTAILSITRGYDANPGTLSAGFRHFGPLLRCLLLQSAVYCITGLGAIYLSSFIFMATPFSDPFVKVMDTNRQLRSLLMVRIVSDTSTLYSTTQAKEAGFAVSALSVTIAGNTYREFDEITSEQFVDIIRQGHMPTTSQPAIGEVEALYNSFPGDEIINVAMAHGLSGTYTSAVAAAQLCENGDRITVVNTRTLCGPHRYMVERAVEWAKNGHSVAQILEKLNELMDSVKSYLVPADFDYLRRGGRLSPLVSHVGKAAGLTPIMTQTEGGERLTVASIRRGYSHTIKYMTKELEKRGIGEGWRVYISHAGAMEKAKQTLDALKAAIPDAYYEILPLSPAFITQGGPGCVAVQYVKA